MTDPLLPLARMARIITDLSLFTPLNLQEEKEKVLADASHTPRFTYKQRDFSIDEYRKELESFLQEPQDEDQRISDLVHERVRELMLWLDMHQAKDNAAFTHASSLLYGTPIPRVLQAAKKDIDEADAKTPAERTLTAQDIRPRFEKALADMGLSWPVVITGGLVGRMHLIKGKELRINKNARFNDLDVEKLIVHEIRTHAKRYVNGLQQDNRIFAIGTAHFLETEEGLATLNEEKANVLTPRVKKNLAARAVAVDMALRKPFNDVYRYLALKVPKEKAFEIALNVKRGLPDQSRPGAFTKAAIYYSGYQKVKTLGEEDARYLYVGKVSINHLPLIKELVNEEKVKLP